MSSALKIGSEMDARTRSTNAQRRKRIPGMQKKRAMVEDGGIWGRRVENGGFLYGTD